MGSHKIVKINPASPKLEQLGHSANPAQIRPVKLLIISPMAALNTAVVFFAALRISAELTSKRGQEFGRKLSDLFRVITAKLLAPVGLEGDLLVDTQGS
jgi:hypothetical protein